MVSIIIPNYNHSRFIKKRLDSILHQTYQEFEIIILDDASTDESVKVLDNYRHHPKVENIVINRKNSGSPYRQWFNGVSMAKGEYIWIAESDDYSDLGFLEICIAELEQNKNAGLAFCKSIFVDELDQEREESKDFFDRFKTVDKTIFNRFVFLCNYLSKECDILNVSSVLFRKDVFDLDVINKITTSFRLFGDWYLYQSIVTKYDVIYVNKPLNYFRKTQKSFSSSYPPVEFLNERIDIHRFLIEKKVPLKVLESGLDHFYYDYFALSKKELNFYKKFSLLKTIMKYDSNWFIRILNYSYYTVKDFLNCK